MTLIFTFGMGNIFTYILVWLQSIFLFRKGRFVASKTIGVLISVLLLISICFAVYVYVKIMQVPRVEHIWQRHSVNVLSDRDSLNVLVSQNLSGSKSTFMPLPIVGHRRLDEISHESRAAGVHWDFSIRNPRNPLASKDIIRKRIVIGDSMVLNGMKEFGLDSLGALDYASFDKFEVSLLPGLYKVICEDKIKENEFYHDKQLRFLSYHNTDLGKAISTNKCNYRFFTGIDFTDVIGDSTIILAGSSEIGWFDHSNVWAKLYDVSRMQYRFSPPQNVHLNSLAVNFGGPTEFLSIYPVPDMEGSHFIVYTDEDKLCYIRDNGLDVAAKFPNAENLQNMKIFVLTSILTVLITWLLTQVYELNKLRLKKLRPKTIIIALTILIISALLYIYLTTNPIVL